MFPNSVHIGLAALWGRELEGISPLLEKVCPLPPAGNLGIFVRVG